MKTLELTKYELTELCFALLTCELTQTKTAKKTFERGRKKLLKELKRLEDETK
jgi:hypothetical protein